MQEFVASLALGILSGCNQSTAPVAFGGSRVGLTLLVWNLRILKSSDPAGPLYSAQFCCSPKLITDCGVVNSHFPKVVQIKVCIALCYWSCKPSVTLGPCVGTESLAKTRAS